MLFDFDPSDLVDSIDCLVMKKAKKKIPRWVIILDYTLTGLYLAVFAFVIVIVLRYFLNGK